MLCLQGLRVCESVVQVPGATVPSTADVVVIAHGALSEAVDKLVFLMSESVDPGMHELDHFSLDLGVGVVELGMEAEQGKTSARVVCVKQ
jgi:hypothetical protein